MQDASRGSPCDSTASCLVHPTDPANHDLRPLKDTTPTSLTTTQNSTNDLSFLTLYFNFVNFSNCSCLCLYFWCFSVIITAFISCVFNCIRVRLLRCLNKRDENLVTGLPIWCQGPPNHIQFLRSQFYTLTTANMVVEKRQKVTINTKETLISAPLELTNSVKEVRLCWNSWILISVCLPVCLSLKKIVLQLHVRSHERLGVATSCPPTTKFVLCTLPQNLTKNLTISSNYHFTTCVVT